MTGASTLPVLAVLVIFAREATSSSVVDERNGINLMRKEKQVELHMHLAASGTVPADADEDDGPLQMCNDDYPLGEEGQVECEGTNSTHLQEPEKCWQAADEANITHAETTLDQEWQNVRPKGCFVKECEQDPKSKCYFYNPILGLPDPSKFSAYVDGVTKVEGTPVCRRPKVRYGDRHNGSFEFVDGRCPAGYGVIMSEKNCSEAARCLGLPMGGRDPGTAFREAVANLSRRDDFPEGCFIHDGPGAVTPPRVYFNPPGYLVGISSKPKRPIGTPICNVSTITMWPPGGPVDSTLHLHTVQHARHDRKRRIGTAAEKTTDAAEEAADADTTIADQAFAQSGNQADYDRIMERPADERSAELEKIKAERAEAAKAAAAQADLEALEAKVEGEIADGDTSPGDKAKETQ